MRTLLSRSIISHIVPVVIAVALIGGVLWFALETQLFVTVDRLAPSAPLPPDGAYPAPAAHESIVRDLELLRLWVVGVVLIALLVGVNLASLSAYFLERPLGRLTLALRNAGAGEPLPPQTASDAPAEIAELVTAFNERNERLKEVERSREHLLANIVHELGRPLGAMRVATRALRDGAAEDVRFRDELFTGIEEEIQRLSRLLDNLVQLGGSTLDTLELRPHPVEIGEWLPAVLRLWQPSAEAKGIEWTAALPDTLPIIVLDPDRMGQVLGNLLSNAIRYTPAGGRVAIRAGQDAAAFWIQVEDSGIGIPAAEQESVFQPFYRSSAHTRFPQGMGLGLPIAREIVAAHGGSLAVSSSVGQGTTFTLRLPQKEGAG